jgi:hypothetical protein
MKTSFAKTFEDYSKGRQSVDLAFPERKTVREILADGNDLGGDNVFVIESYNAEYKSEKISTLLANKQLKQEYDTIHKEIDKSKAELLKKLKQLSGLSGRNNNIEATLEEIFGKSFFDALLDLEKSVVSSDPLPFHSINYSIIFNDKVLNFLKTKDFKESIKKYIEKYDELIEKSPYLNKNFKFHHAENIQRQLVANNFFQGGHSVNLFDGSGKKEYSSDEELQAILTEERNKIFSDEGLRGTFEEISKKLSNKELQEFRDYLLDNKEILPELDDLSGLAKIIWMAYFVDQKSLFVDLVEKYKNGQNVIEGLLEKAKQEKTDWEEVVRIFNTRFSHLPFSVNIANKEDVILKEDVETIQFIFKDGAETRSFENKNDLLKILSTGEKRALYILNIIFEVEVRKKQDGITLFIVDDIADSFDYKNKYAIVEYLKYMSDENKFYMIILSHNFDFFRTIQSRGVSTYNQSLIAFKKDLGVALEPIKYLNNPFVKDWKLNLSDRRKLVASIPFVRNIIEYTKGMDNDDYKLLTSIVHYKSGVTDLLKVENIKEVFERNIQDITFPSVVDQNMIDFIFDTAESCLSAEEGLNLENKIVLSIAIRLKAEQFMATKITDKAYLTTIESAQNYKMLKKYMDEYNNEEKNIELLKRVNLITPINIHVNSFMYEPILDMGDGELRDLYTVVKENLK